MNWFGNRFGETYTYVRVAWEGWSEVETYDYITGGSIEYSADNSLKVTGSFNYDGLELPDTSDLLRVYYNFRDDDGEEIKVPLATLFVSFSSNKYVDTTSGMKSSGTLTGSSVLQALERDKIGVPYTLNTGANVIYKAQQLVVDAGLRIDFDPDPTALKEDITFSAGTDKLEIVNTLCEIAGYEDAWPDAEGVVHIHPPINQSIPDFTFANDNESIMYPEIEDTNNWQSSPNVYKLLYNTDIGCVIAEAKNLTGSKSSLDMTGGRPNVQFEEVTDVGEGTISVLLKLLAEERLKDASCDVEYVTVSHAYYPIYLYDLVGVRYSELTWTGTVNNMSIDLATGTKTRTKLQRILENDIEIQSSSQVLRTLTGVSENYL